MGLYFGSLLFHKVQKLILLAASCTVCIPNDCYFSILMWIFDKYSPYSYQNNIEKYKDDEEKRYFNFKECLWFCMTSLTPQVRINLYFPKKPVSIIIVKGRRRSPQESLRKTGGSYMVALWFYHHRLLHREFGCLFDRFEVGDSRGVPGGPFKAVQNSVLTLEPILRHGLL